MKVDLKSYDNNWYKPGNFFKISIWYIVNHLFINTSLHMPYYIKTMVLRFFGAKIGKNVFIKPNVNIKYPWLLQIGDNVWIGESVWIDNLAQVTIMSNVCVSQGATLLCGNHNYKKSSFDLIIGEIVVEDGVWIGAKSTVCPGVTLKSHSVLTVGSVANEDLKPYTINKGNPAVKIKERIIKK